MEYSRRVEQDRTELENQNKYMCKEKKPHIETHALNTSPECMANVQAGRLLSFLVSQLFSANKQSDRGIKS